MLGRTLVRHLRQHTVHGLTRDDGDLAEPGVARALCGRFRPDVVLHCAAYTRVDDAESEADQAYRDNVIATSFVADAARATGAHLVFFSTDYVFSGESNRPYLESDPVGPWTAYGRTKAWAEDAVRTHCPEHAIFRIAWLYGAGGPSLLHTAVRLARTRPHPLAFVDDQRGNPTSCDAVAAVVEAWLHRPFVGTAHATCEGEATWFEFVVQAFERLGLNTKVDRTTSDAFVRPAPRPRNSRLENRWMRLCGGPSMPNWTEALDDFLKRYPQEFEG